MTEHDILGNPVTVGAPDTVAGIDAFVHGLLSYETGIERVIEAADADPDSALANAYAAMAWLFLESPAGPLAALPYLRCAEAAAAAGSGRERLIVAAARAWADDDMVRALAIGDRLAAEYPRDLVAAKVTQYHMFNRGDAAGLLRIGAAVLPACDDIAYAHGMIAFGYEQCHRMREAEAAAHAAMRRQRKEPWAHHALAHVLLTEGRNDEGRAFLDDVRDTWTGLNSFMLTHNWWHLSLVMIAQGEAAAVLEHYSTHIWGICKDYSQDQVGAVSLLARLELAGVDVGDRWQDLADHLAPRITEHVQPFLDLHYLYGLARAGRAEAPAMLEDMRRFAVAAPGHARETWQSVALPAAAGLLAHARGDHAAAVPHLLAALPRLAAIGGSHAQRDLFEQITDDALLRAGHHAAARARLERRRGGNPHAAATLAAVQRLPG